MNILLLKKIKNLGEVGAEVSVKSGYARNYLIPQDMAIYATKNNIVQIETRIEKREKKYVKKNQKAF